MLNRKKPKGKRAQSRTTHTNSMKKKSRRSEEPSKAKVIVETRNKTKVRTSKFKELETTI